jgi:sugar phosphate isomerase/epimerase
MITSISNLAWSVDETPKALKLLQKYNIKFIEIAPSKIFSHQVFSKSNQKKILNFRLMIEDEGFKITSMQSVLYGLEENLFGSDDEARIIVNRLKAAIELADMIDCRHIVFGSPRNRMNYSEIMLPKAISIFSEIEQVASSHAVVIGVEGNSRGYGNSFLTNASQVVDFVSLFDSKYLKCNFDSGNEIMERRDLTNILNLQKEVSQIQISMPHLLPIKLDICLEGFLDFCSKNGLAMRQSIEMLSDDLGVLEATLESMKKYTSIAIQ